VNGVVVGMIPCSIQVSDGDDEGISETKSQGETREIECQDDQQTELTELKVYEQRHKQQQHEQLVSSCPLVTTTADVPINSSLDPSPASSSQAIDSIPDPHVLPRRTTRVNAGRPPSRFGCKTDISNLVSYAYIPPA
jgi:hypothetical protein